MKRGIIYVIIAALLLLTVTLVSCAVAKESEKKSTDKRVEIRYEYLISHDTINVPVPFEQARNVTRDTFSILSTTLATSTASIDTLGFLHHSLENRSDKVFPVTVDKITEVRDSVVYVDKINTQTKTVTKTVKAELNWWQNAQIYGFWIMLLAVIWAYRKNFAKLFSKMLAYFKK